MLSGDHGCLLNDLLLSDFRRRFVQLLSYQFSEFHPSLAMSLLQLKKAKKNDSEGESFNGDYWGLGDVTSFYVLSDLSYQELLVHLSHYDIKRLELYSQNLVDHHLITDLLPIVARLYFLKKIDIDLSVAQSVSHCGLTSNRPSTIGIFRRSCSVSDYNTRRSISWSRSWIYHQLSYWGCSIVLSGRSSRYVGLPEHRGSLWRERVGFRENQTGMLLRHLLGGNPFIQIFPFQVINDLCEQKMATDLGTGMTGERKIVAQSAMAQSLEEDLREGAAEFEAQMKQAKKRQQHQVALDDKELAQFAIRGTEDDWNDALEVEPTGNTSKVGGKLGLVSVKRKTMDANQKRRAPPESAGLAHGQKKMKKHGGDMKKKKHRK